MQPLGYELPDWGSTSASTATSTLSSLADAAQPGRRRGTRQARRARNVFIRISCREGVTDAGTAFRGRLANAQLRVGPPLARRVVLTDDRVERVVAHATTRQRVVGLRLDLCVDSDVDAVL